MFIKKFENFRGGYVDRRVQNSRKKELTYLTKKVEIRVDLESIYHVYGERQFRHNEMIEDDEIIETVEAAIEEITIALMQDQFDIYQYEDNYPTRGIKAGEPNRFVVKNKEDLNVVCELRPGDNEFTLTVITVMREPNFRIYPGQWIVEV